MTSPSHTFKVHPSSTVADVLEQFPESVSVFQRHQRGISGTCVITREDSIRDLCNRFGVPVSHVIEDLETLRSEV